MAQKNIGSANAINAWHMQSRTLANALKPQPPTEYIIDKFIEAGSLNIVYGAPSTLKSMLLADLCAAVVSGNDWLAGATGRGQGYIATHTGVLWVDTDNGRRRTDARFGAIARHYGLDKKCPLTYLSMPNPPLNGTDSELMQNFGAWVKNDVGAGLIVIDNLGLVRGDTEENNASMAQVMANFRAISEDSGAAVCLIHHDRKGGANGSRAGDALRGHSSIEASIDLALRVTREYGSNRVSLQSTKTRGVDVPLTHAEFCYTHIPGTNDLDTACFVGIAHKAGASPVRDAIMQALNDAGGKLKKTELRDAAMQASGKSWRVVGDYLKTLLDAGELFEVPQGNTKWICTKAVYNPWIP